MARQRISAVSLRQYGLRYKPPQTHRNNAMEG
jgi:hypothetical protein